jgi:Tannase and feruloyl esterase
MGQRVFCGAIAAISLGIASGSALAQPAATVSPPNAVTSCSALLSTAFSHVEDAPFQLTDAHVVAASGESPAYCRVRGYIWPQVGIEMHLPLANWNGKFMEVGDGGWGGEMYLFLCKGPVRRGYACIASDMGHQGKTGLGLWARDNPAARADWGFRATHVTAVAGRALVNAYYGKSPSRSYMYGCSTGGYQGLVESQRFPWDFNGIVAIAPDATSEADISMRQVWMYRNLYDAHGKPLFSTSDLALLHRAALRACDIGDGLKDGIIGNPFACKFDPAVLACRAGHGSGCLSPQQITAARNIYAGPHTSSGVAISTRGVFPGSEMDWASEPGASTEVAEFFKYILYRPAPGTGWTINDFDFDHDYTRLGLGAEYTDNNPDLRRFKAAGAKLIVAQGGNDGLEIPGAIFDYYETVERAMGGRRATMDFFRLFLVPGMRHCSSGDGAFAVDYLSYLEAWVEKGHPPDMMVGAHVDSRYLLAHSPDRTGKGRDRIWSAAFRLTYPLGPNVPVSFTRPLYPYPAYARFKGKGDPDDARNFAPVD